MGTNHKEWTEHHPLRVICRLLISLIALKLYRSRDSMKAHGHCSAVICFSRVAVPLFASAASEYMQIKSRCFRALGVATVRLMMSAPLDQKTAEMCRCRRRRRVKQCVIACQPLGLRDTSDLRRLTIVLYTTHRQPPSSSSSTPPPDRRARKSTAADARLRI